MLPGLAEKLKAVMHKVGYLHWENSFDMKTVQHRKNAVLNNNNKKKGNGDQICRKAVN